MRERKYSASLSQSQGRSGYSIIFRHPARRANATGSPGVRVRRGLGTRDRAEAERLRDQLNELLADPKYHDPAARVDAERRYDPRVVEIFFDKIVPEEFDFQALRDEAIPLPNSASDNYRRVLFLGTTGAGKTTLVRQLIGTDPVRERFPSTSTAKTTIHDTEIVLDDGPWRAVVTFVSRDEAREYLNECISAATLAAANDGTDDATVLRRLLNHVDQRFRFSYVLGSGPKVTGGDFDFEEEPEEVDASGGLPSAGELAGIDLAATDELLAHAVTELRSLAQRLAEGLRAELNARGEEDERVVDEIFEEELDNLLRDEETYHEIADALMDEIEKRFDLLPPGNVRKTTHGWPLAWRGEWPVEEKAEFLKAVSRFSSNYAPLFGCLLTPLVNGVRVAGPFSPSWAQNQSYKLVLLDGEGLGHTPNLSSPLPTPVSRRIDTVDAVILVDNATQPMQAAPIAAMRELVATGNATKLILAFTHFDEVKGDNLPNAPARAQHVLASAENVLAAFGEELGPYAERALRGRLAGARFFLADIHEPLDHDSTAGRRTISQLKKLLDSVDQAIQKPQIAESHPVYDRMNLALAIHAATDAFHDAWQPRLGLAIKAGCAKEHWTRVKALSRRLARGMKDEYDSLKPVADLKKELAERMYVFIQNPLRWEGHEPSEEEKQRFYDALASSLSGRLLDLSTRRVWREHSREWQSAYDEHGIGSTFVRARIIGKDIYEPAAPVPNVTPSPDQNQFLREVVTEVEAAAEEVDARLL